MLSLSFGWAQTVLSFKEAAAQVEFSPRVVLAQSQLELAQKQLELTASWLQTSVTGGYTQTWSSVEVGGETTDENEGNLDPIGLNAAFNVVPYGPWFERVQQARWGLERARLNVRDESSSVLLDTTAQFQSVLRAKESVAVQQETLELSRLHLEATQTRLDAGAATASDLLQAELSVQQVQQDFVSAEREFAQALAALSSTLGQTVGGVAGPLPEPSAVLSVSDDLLKGRSDVVNALLSVAEAEQTAAATLRENLPSGALSVGYSVGGEDSTFSLGAQYSVGGPGAYQPTLNLNYDSDTGLPNFQAGTQQSFSLGLDITIPFDVALPDALEAARLSVEQARLRAEQTLTLARLEVETRAAELEGARASRDLAEQILAERRSTLGVTQQRLNLGLISPLALAEAEVNVLEAELGLHRAEDALRLAAMRFAAALAVHPLEVF